MRRLLRFSTMGVALVTAISFSTAQASPATDTGDHFNHTKSKETVVNVGNTVLTTSGSPSVTVTCTHSGTSFTTPATGLGPMTLANPTFNDGGTSSCTDSLHLSDTVKSNSTNGKWTLKFIDATNDETAHEPAAGDKMQLTIPKAGLTDSVQATCTVTVAPNGPVTVTGVYDDLGKLTITNAAIPISISGLLGCPTATSANFTATYAVTPGLTDLS